MGTSARPNGLNKPFASGNVERHCMSCCRGGRVDRPRTSTTLMYIIPPAVRPAPAVPRRGRRTVEVCFKSIEVLIGQMYRLCGRWMVAMVSEMDVFVAKSGGTMRAQYCKPIQIMRCLAKAESLQQYCTV